MLTKKCAILSSFLLLLTGILQAQFRTTDFRLLGKVESVQSVTYAYENPSKTEVSGFLDSEQFDSVYLKFDRRRNLILHENFLDYRGKLGLFDRTILQINPSNQLEKLETTLIQNGEEPRKISQRKKFYYLRNQLVRQDEFNSGRTSDQYWVTNYLYEKGNLIAKHFWMEDELFSVDRLEYNLRNQISKETNFHNNGRSGKTVEYIYSDGVSTKKITTSGNEKTIESFIYNDGLLSGYELIEKSGRLLEAKTYNRDGLIKSVKKFNHLSQSIDNYDFKYKKDRENNWVFCEISKNSLPVYLVKRKINYFKN